MGVRVCGWQRVIVASGAAWAPCCYPATLQAGHAFSGFCGSAAAPFTALHHPVREHPAPHKRLHIRRARTHTHTHTHAHARTHTATDIAYPTYKPLPEYTSHHTHTHTHTHTPWVLIAQARLFKRAYCRHTGNITRAHRRPKRGYTPLYQLHTHTHTHTRTHTSEHTHRYLAFPLQQQQFI